MMKNIAQILGGLSVLAGAVVLGLVVRVMLNSDIGWWSWSNLLSLYLDIGVGFGLIGIGGLTAAILSITEKKSE